MKTLTSDEIYDYILKLSNKFNDENTENVLEFLNKYDEFELVTVSIDELEIEQPAINTKKVDEYIKLFKETNKYPPIVIDNDYNIIDGYHRANALKKIGLSKIKAYVPV